MQGTEIGRSAFYVYFAGIRELAAVFVYELSAKIEAASAGRRDLQVIRSHGPRRLCAAPWSSGRPTAR